MGKDIRGVEVMLGDTVALANHDCEFVIGKVTSFISDKSIELDISHGQNIKEAYFDEIVVLKEPVVGSERSEEL